MSKAKRAIEWPEVPPASQIAGQDELTEKPAEQIAATDQSKKAARFVSKFATYRVVIRPQRVIPTASGYVQVNPGKAAVFTNGELVTDDAEVIRFLRSYAQNGIDYTES